MRYSAHKIFVCINFFSLDLYSCRPFSLHATCLHTKLTELLLIVGCFALPFNFSSCLTNIRYSAHKTFVCINTFSFDLYSCKPFSLHATCLHTILTELILTDAYFALPFNISSCLTNIRHFAHKIFVYINTFSYCCRQFSLHTTHLHTILTELLLTVTWFVLPFNWQSKQSNGGF